MKISADDASYYAIFEVKQKNGSAFIFQTKPIEVFPEMEVKGFTISVNDLLSKQKKKSTVCDNFNMQILINNAIVFDDMTYG